MFKFLTYIVLGYLAYRVFIKPRKRIEKQPKKEYNKWQRRIESLIYAVTFDHATITYKRYKEWQS